MVQLRLGFSPLLSDCTSGRYMNFAQICGALGDFSLNWPPEAGAFMTYLGVLDFDVDAIGPNCVYVTWSWQQDLYLQLLLPVLVLAVNKSQYLAAKLLLMLRLPRFRLLKLLGIAPENKQELSELQDELNMKVIVIKPNVYGQSVSPWPVTGDFVRQHGVHDSRPILHCSVCLHRGCAG